MSVKSEDQPPTHLNGVLLASHSYGVRSRHSNIHRCPSSHPQKSGVHRTHEVLEVLGAAELVSADLSDAHPVTVARVSGDRLGHNDFGGAVFLNTIGARLAAEVGNVEAAVIVL